MNIRHVNLAKGLRGGERQTILLIQALAEFGVSQSLVCRGDSPMISILKSSGIQFIKSNNALSGHRKAPKPDIIHAHEAKAVHWSWIESKLNSKPYLITRRINQPPKTKWFTQKTYADAAYVVGVSSPVKKALMEYCDTPCSLVHDAFSGAPNDPKKIADLKERFSKNRVVGHIGALVDKDKGQFDLLKAAKMMQKSHPDVRFLFLGQGVDEAALKDASVDLKNVIWEGFKSNIGDYLEIMDLFAFPSRNEGLGSSLLDAIDHNVPIVASSAGGIPDLIKHRQTGLLVPPNEAEPLYAALVELLDNPTYAKQLAEQAHKTLDQFTPQSMAKSYLKLYQDIFRVH